MSRTSDEQNKFTQVGTETRVNTSTLDHAHTELHKGNAYNIDSFTPLGENESLDYIFQTPIETELVTNGNAWSRSTGSLAPTGWATGSDSNIESLFATGSEGVLVITNTSSSATGYVGIEQRINGLAIGRTYTVTHTGLTGTGGQLFSAGSTSGANDYISQSLATPTSTQITATATDLFLGLRTAISGSPDGVQPTVQADEIGLKVDEAKVIHMTFIIESNLQAEIALLEGVTTNTGSFCTPNNRNRDLGGYPSLVVSITGSQTAQLPASVTTLMSSSMGAAALPAGRGVGGGTRSDNEWMLARGTKYLLRTTSRAADNVVDVELNWYED